MTIDLIEVFISSFLIIVHTRSTLYFKSPGIKMTSRRSMDILEMIFVL